MEVLLTKDYIVEQISKKGMSKADFAAKMGILRQNLDSMLDSKKKDINLVVKMAEVLDVPLLEFIGQPREKDIHGCIYVDGKPNLIKCKDDLASLLSELE